jgi:hypothetical protein
MQIVCKTCAAPIKAENLNLENCIGKCEYCNSLTYFGESMRPAKASVEQYREQGWTEQKDALERHARFEVQEEGDDLVIRYRWFTWSILFLMFFCVLWDGFLVVWYVIGFASGGPWMMFIFPILHVAVGVGLTYAVVCSFVNSTEIRVNRQEISVSHGPLPCVKNEHLPASEVKQLYCVEKVTRNENSTSRKYHVMAAWRGGKHKNLITGFQDASQAIYLERLIEKYLQIEDQYVSGEHRL